MKESQKLKIEYIPKEQLKLYANNAKIHTAEQIEQIKKSIRDFSFNDPIAIWHDNQVVEGHGRLLAAMEMDDIEEVPVIRLDSLTDEQRRAYMLVHNKLTMNTNFDFSLLEMELDNLPEFDMTQFGFDDIHLDSFFDEDEVESPKEETAPTFKIIVTCKDEEEKMSLIAILQEKEIEYTEL